MLCGGVLNTHTPDWVNVSTELRQRDRFSLRARGYAELAGRATDSVRVFK